MKNSDFSKEVAFAASQNIKEREYWMDKLSGDLVKTFFMPDFKQPGMEINKNDPRIDTVEFRLSGELFSGMMKLTRGSDYKLHILLAAVLVLLLDKYTGRGDIIIGIPIYKQEIEVELINTVLAVRNQVNPGMSFKEFLIQAAQSVFEANENQNYPIETLLYKLNIPVSPENADFPLFHFYLKISMQRSTSSISGLTWFFPSPASMELSGGLWNITPYITAKIP